jgi:hypothetical protein
MQYSTYIASLPKRYARLLVVVFHGVAMAQLRFLKAARFDIVLGSLAGKIAWLIMVNNQSSNPTV